jgi:uncharacterized protein (DUF1684 family)
MTGIYRLAARRLVAVLVLTAACSVATMSAVLRQNPPAPYVASIEQWRAEREIEIKADDGWLTVVGLTWLKDGANQVGSSASSAIRLDAADAPARVGVFEFHAGVTTFVPEPGVQVRINGQPASRQVLRFDGASPDRVQVGTTTMFIIRRGDRSGVRVKDTTSKARREFAGLTWFPIQPAYQVTARFVPHEKPTSIMIANVVGDLDPWLSPGYVVFMVAGRELRLQPVVEGPNARRLFFIIKDQTSGKDTYGGGRFLYTEMPKNGQVVIDFNKAENPPCAYTAFATCPLPPKENVLPVRIEAGEKNTHPTPTPGYGSPARLPMSAPRPARPPAG